MSSAEDRSLQLFLIHLKAGRKQEANKVLQRIVQSDPAKAAPYALLIGGLLAQNNQFEDAVPLYQEAIRLNPNEPVAYFHLGVAYHALNRENESNHIWDELAKRFPDHGTDHYQKALRLLKINELTQAKTELERAVKLLEDNKPMQSDALKTISTIDEMLSGKK